MTNFKSSDKLKVHNKNNISKNDICRKILLLD